jgi:hypothetical protein
LPAKILTLGLVIEVRPGIIEKDGLPAKILILGLVIEIRPGIIEKDVPGGKLTVLVAPPILGVGTKLFDRGFDSDMISLLSTRVAGIGESHSSKSKDNCDKK